MTHPYNPTNSNTGVLNYELLPGAIILEFRHSPHRYLYNADAPGPEHVRAMTHLALAGRGLSTYVSRHVHEHYARKLPKPEQP